ncbi:MAG TPA: hypothetical protein VFP54_00840 [Acidimicrobiales bacterium]|nr:hypothetical protein [Acidimicrobiales bacterium]
MTTAASCTDIAQAPPEPSELKHRLHRSVLDRPQEWHADDENRRPLSDWLWAQWNRELTAGGVDRRTLEDIVGGYRQELWLWLMGERTWAHTVEGLIGRIQRRAPVGPPRPTGTRP